MDWDGFSGGLHALGITASKNCQEKDIWVEIEVFIFIWLKLILPSTEVGRLPAQPTSWWCVRKLWFTICLEIPEMLFSNFQFGARVVPYFKEREQGQQIVVHKKVWLVVDKSSRSVVLKEGWKKKVSSSSSFFFLSSVRLLPLNAMTSFINCCQQKQE